MAHAAPTSPQSPPNCNVSTPTRNNQCSTFSSYRPLPALPARNLKRAKLSRVLPSPPATPMFRLVSLGYSPPRRRASRLLRLASPTPDTTTPVSELNGYLYYVAYFSRHTCHSILYLDGGPRLLCVFVLLHRGSDFAPGLSTRLKVLY